MKEKKKIGLYKNGFVTRTVLQIRCTPSLYNSSISGCDVPTDAAAIFQSLLREKERESEREIFESIQRDCVRILCTDNMDGRYQREGNLR